MLAQRNRHEESMYALKKLALEIIDMDEYERLKTLEWVIKLEVEGRGNRFWILVVKYLLGKPELLQSAIKLADLELNPHSGETGEADSKPNVRHVNFGGNSHPNLPDDSDPKSSLHSFFSKLTGATVV